MAAAVYAEVVEAGNVAQGEEPAAAGCKCRFGSFCSCARARAQARAQASSSRSSSNEPRSTGEATGGRPKQRVSSDWEKGEDGGWVYRGKRGQTRPGQRQRRRRRLSERGTRWSRSSKPLLSICLYDIAKGEYMGIQARPKPHCANKPFGKN